jgi:nitrite reductase/ring-hydroxylating ferredoxin subunit
MANEGWVDVGPSDELARRPLQLVLVESRRVALSHNNGEFGAISDICAHVGGPLSEGYVRGYYVVCPLHYRRFHCLTGEGEAGSDADRVPSYEVRVENGRVLVRNQPRTRPNVSRHTPRDESRTPDGGADQAPGGWQP